MNKIKYKNVEYDYAVQNDLDRIFLEKDGKQYAIFAEDGSVYEIPYGTIDPMLCYMDQEEFDSYIK